MSTTIGCQLCGVEWMGAGYNPVQAAAHVFNACVLFGVDLVKADLCERHREYAKELHAMTMAERAGQA
jgi:hypothetical protein